MRAEKSRLQEEAKRQIEDRTRYLDEIRASYQNFLNDFHKAKLNAKSAEDLIGYARDTIAKAQILLQDNDQTLEQKRKMEKLSSKDQLY